MIKTKATANKLTDTEKSIISLAVFHNYMNGSFGNMEWEVEVDFSSMTMEERYAFADFISIHIGSGFVQGNYPVWKLTYKRYKSIDDEDYYEGKITI